MEQEREKDEMTSPEELESGAERWAYLESLLCTPHIAPHHGKHLRLISQEPIEFCVRLKRKLAAGFFLAVVRVRHLTGG
jgi:hypothetical protein